MITLRLVTLIAFLFFASNVWSKSEKESATWQDGYDAIYSTKTWGLAKPRKYMFSVSPQGDVTLNMGKAKHLFFKDGKLLKSNRPDQIPSQMTKICEQSFGTRLHSIKTKPKKFVMDWHYPSIVTAKCISREKY